MLPLESSAIPFTSRRLIAQHHRLIFVRCINHRWYAIYRMSARPACLTHGPSRCSQGRRQTLTTLDEDSITSPRRSLIAATVATLYAGPALGQAVATAHEVVLATGVAPDLASEVLWPGAARLLVVQLNAEPEHVRVPASGLLMRFSAVHRTY